MIEKASFDTKKSYTLIPKPVKVVQVSSSSETDESNNNVDDHDDDKEHSGDELFKIQDRSKRSPIKLGRELKHSEEFSFSSSSLSEDFTIRKDSNILQRCCSQDESLVDEISKELKDEADLEVLLEIQFRNTMLKLIITNIR